MTVINAAFAADVAAPPELMAAEVPATATVAAAAPMAFAAEVPVVISGSVVQAQGSMPPVPPLAPLSTTLESREKTPLDVVVHKTTPVEPSSLPGEEPEKLPEGMPPAITLGPRAPPLFLA